MSVTSSFPDAIYVGVTSHGVKAKREETFWSVTLSFQDLHDCSSTLTCAEWDSLPLGALERVMARYGISRDRVRSVSVETNGGTRTIG